MVLGRVLAELFIFFTRAPFVMRIAFSINWPKVIFHMWSTVAACYISWLTHNELFSSLNYIIIMSKKRNHIGIIILKLNISLHLNLIYLSWRALSLRVLLYTSASVRGIYKVFEAATFCWSRCGIISKVLADRAWALWFLFVTFSSLFIIIHVPFRLTITASSASLRIQIKKFTYIQ